MQWTDPMPGTQRYWGALEIVITTKSMGHLGRKYSLKNLYSKIISDFKDMQNSAKIPVCLSPIVTWIFTSYRMCFIIYFILLSVSVYIIFYHMFFFLSLQGQGMFFFIFGCLRQRLKSISSYFILAQLGTFNKIPILFSRFLLGPQTLHF